MKWITQHIKWIMLLAGIITFSMIYALFAPQAVLMSMFGESLQSNMAEVVVRNWGALIGLMGGVLIYGAFNPLQRPLALVLAGLSKIAFIGLVITFGFAQQLLSAVILDCVFVCIFAYYLLAKQVKV